MTLPTTSGTVSQYGFTQGQIIDHAFRRAGLQPEQASSENIQIAQDLLFSILSEWSNAGFPLWTKQYLTLGPVLGSPDVACPLGTVDVIHAYWRNLNPYRGPAVTSDGQDATVLFGGTVNSDITITGTTPHVQVSFGSSTGLYTVGVLLGGTSSITTSLQILGSNNNVTYTVVQTLPSTTFTPGVWQYFDLNPVPSYPYFQVQYASGTPWVLNQLNFGLANASDIMIGPLNIDDYYNLPSKFQQGDRAVSAWVDRQLNYPVIKLWNVPNQLAFYNGLVSVLTRRYIQDPGQMSNAVEIPQRCNEALMWRLACSLIYEIKDREDASAAQAGYMALMQRQQRIQQIETKATKAESLMWAEERSKGPIKIMPRTRCYTR